ncbi:shikimate dehydrogenase [Desulfolucanica intricata]|uniref:shikimate dehydrogenase n=1 Tax=Desulfolucanica intricata TaxID=1285191 RepID=UPI00082D41EF|nr:shikimate dehydrogenase [Desulfolucanica intricata]
MAFTRISGSTKLCGIIGNPVEHSLSPVMHNAAFLTAGLNYAYVPYRVSKECLADAVSAVRALNMVGVNITVPHKQAVINYLDEISTEAKLFGAVNTVVNQKGSLIGYNTDGQGFVRSIKEQAEFSPDGKSILILGAGGAARSVAVQLALSGAGVIYIANRTYERALEITNLIESNTACIAKPVLWKDAVHIKDIVPEVELIVQTTPQGMYPDNKDIPNCPLLFHDKQLVCDLIYNPPKTLFLKSAQKCGAKILNGIGMLIYQGALAFELWTGQKAPVEAMEEALRKVL